jgi:hypothetical protein
VEPDGVSVASGVCFNICQKTLDGNIRIVGWNRLPGVILFQVEMSSDREDGEWAVASVFVMRRVLCSIHFKETIVFIGIHSGAGDSDVHLRSHVISFCRNKLENELIICLQEGMGNNALERYPQRRELCPAL